MEYLPFLFVVFLGIIGLKIVYPNESIFLRIIRWIDLFFSALGFFATIGIELLYYLMAILLVFIASTIGTFLGIIEVI